MSVQIQHPGEPFCEQPLETTRLTPNYRIDLRNARNLHPDRFLNANIVRDWSLLSWKEVGKPYQVENMSKTRTSWEKKQGKSMPAHTSWEYFNKSFHEWFEKNVPAEKSEAAKSFWKHVSGFNLKEVRYAFKDLMMIHLWNYAHRIQDGIWDPRGKRALFQGLDLDKPRILFLERQRDMKPCSFKRCIRAGNACWSITTSFARRPVLATSRKLTRSLEQILPRGSQKSGIKMR
ncbi:hypothetical protein [Paenibacillus larvae]|uniref:hypothetical protein n=1 Tax=Paenibacillus larvae TaxID=1464 RepID=UPI001F42ADA3|nr:hypothetical protein [Paenibacillus larvae]